jgi:energy-coupling factor transport system permease protein
MSADAFSKRHPVVNFIFFLGAIGFGVVIQHPVYLAAGFLCSSAYYLLLRGVRGLKLLLGLALFFLVMTAINPLFNIHGRTTLFSLFGRPYTLEGIYYGAAVAGALVIMLIWFGCYNTVLTSDKFTSLFGNLIPALSLLLVMVFRLIPNLMRKAKQFMGARKSIGKGAGENASRNEKVVDGMTIVSALTDWALEGSVVTGDAMRSRGYGTSRRSSFVVYRMTGIDFGLLVGQCALILVILASVLTGAATATYTPDLFIAPVQGIHTLGFLAYCLYLLIPTILHIKETIQWHISRSKICAFPTPLPRGMNR